MPQNPEPEKTAAQAEMLGNRLRKRYKHLKKWANRIRTDAFRLYDRDIPEIPLVLDCYGDAVSLAIYKRPYEKDPAEEAAWLAAMKTAASQALEKDASLVFLKERERQRGSSQYDKLQNRRLERDVREGGLIFRVNLSDYLDTGLFPDRRLMRGLVGEEAAGKRILNLFCYTASFSVYAAAGGAREIDSVDLSQTYLDWAAVNFSLNGFEARRVSPQALVTRTDPAGGGTLPPYRLISADALRFIDEARRAHLTWDTIILDPPTFSNSKRMAGTLDIRRDHRDLISQAVSRLNPGGTLWFSTNARGFKLEAGDFPGAVITDLGSRITDEDFRGRRIPACYTIRV
ncbi:methyltransferase [Spirochaetia bacterium]|nr:methyltransferase [Spirochaetia bacterium]